MTGLALQIDGKWAVLDEDVSVSIEDNSPVWGDGNSFSLPFSLSVEANRHILGNSDQITGQSVYEALDGRRAVLYTLGIPVYYGKIKMDDEVEIADGYVDVTLVSGNLTFDEMIDGMNCQDVELKDEIVIGERVVDYNTHFYGYGGKDRPEFRIPGYFPTAFMRMQNNGISTINVSAPYPDAKYCNIRICYQKPEQNGEGEDESIGTSGDDPDLRAEYLIPKIYKVTDEKYGRYVVLEADRPMSAPCFFVLYFLDCLFTKIGYDFSNKGISYIEDMNRLIFCNTKCSFNDVETGRVLNYNGVNDLVGGIYMNVKGIGWEYTWNWEAPLKKCIANSGNFPNADVSNVIESLEDAFGIRFFFDEKSSKATCAFVKDILKDQEVCSIENVEIYETIKIENHIKGFRLTYGGNEDDTAFNYTDWNKNTILTDSYNTITNEVIANNKNLYIDTRTGNSYRIKVDDDAKTASEKNPALFEVGTFNDVEFGDCSNEDQVDTIEIGLSPMVVNDVVAKQRLEDIRKNVNVGDEVSDSEINNQVFAYFVDVDMMYPSFPPYIKVGAKTPYGNVEIKYTYPDTQRFNESRTNQALSAISDDTPEYTIELGRNSRVRRIKGPYKYITAEAFENNSPIQEYDPGIMIGIMRGPGREAGVEDISENYDGEGNFRYHIVEQDYTVHSDTVDNYARVWDYNGKESGGVSQEGRFSLKLRAEKPNPEGGFYPITNVDAQRRGLFDKFYTEYAYFVVNRKIVKMVCRMEMADVLNIDWTKRYKIGDYTGFINKYSYTVDSTGMSDVTIEMYYV